MVARYYLDVAHHKRLLRNTIAVPQLYERYANTVKLSEKIKAHRCPVQER